MKLRLPVKQIVITQPFGVNYVDFYKKWNMRGHNGIDFKVYIGTEIYACHSGEVSFAGLDTDGGISVTLIDHSGRFKTIYYHLSKVLVKTGDIVSRGDQIGLGGNTGKYTTGAHLHLGLKELDFDGDTINKKNGYRGAINPSPYFTETYDGKKINPKDWHRSRVYHRYYRGRPKGGYWIEKYRVVPYLIRRWKRLPNNEEINAAVYGGWDVETIEDPAMYVIWSQLKKSEYLAGEKPINASIGVYKI